MNQQIDERKLFNVLLMFGGALFSLVVVYFVVSAQGNVVANAYKFFLPLGFLFGLCLPKPAFYVLLLCTGYIDLLKRFMVFDLQMQLEDLYYILGIPPAICLGIAVHVVSSFLLQWRKLDQREGRLLVIGMSFCLALGAFALVYRSGAQNIVQSTVYPTMIFTLPIFFPKREDILRLCRYIILIFIPVALYAMKQAIFGLSDFELKYTLSGMTTVTSAVFDQAVRPFSTMASEGQLSLTMSFVALLVFMIPLIMYQERKANAVIMTVCVLLFLLFAAAGLLSLKRLPVLIWVVGIIGCFVFSSKAKTFGFYFMTGVLLLVIIFSGRQLMYMAEEQRISADFDSTTANMLLRTGTFNSRLNAFEILVDPTSYSIAGVPFHERSEKQRKIHTHFAYMLLNYGAPAFFIAGGLLFYGLIYLHQKSWNAPRGKWKAMYLLFSSCLLAQLVTTGMGSLAMSGFPSFFYLMFCLAVLLTLLIKDPWTDDLKVEERKADPYDLDARRPVLH
ncbi:MAG: hypothetical protein AAGK14_11375 [Verrucomicrobiota bacterium]